MCSQKADIRLRLTSPKSTTGRLLPSILKPGYSMLANWLN